MKIYENRAYLDDVKDVSNLNLPWEKLQNKTMLISGATGLIGSCLVDVIMMRNKKGLNCKIYALGRNKDKAMNRFAYCTDNKLYEFISHDISNPIIRDGIDRVDFALHLASNTHPALYALDPIGTITTNVFGTYNVLEFAKNHKATRCMLTSSNEIYGENRGDVELFDEHYCGYIDSNTIRAGYPESKRVCEALCQAFIKQENMDIVISRPTRSYGPTMIMSDTKAISQFIKKGIAGEDVVLKSEGTQYYSYAYVTDVVAGLLTVLLKGKCGAAYNIADASSDITLKDLAKLIADISNKEVVFEKPDVVEAIGYSKATKARLNSARIHELGWKPKYDIVSGIKHTMDILKTLD